ncbi:MAG: four helix bundle protein [Acidobacteria bacterium]|nr:four helix bundle protein [Acidobacteriota bacterium]MCL5287668.1 four helix bundle protein [Acidobacteriota bacterium]
MSAPIRSYRDLLVWQKAMDLVEISYRLSRRLPDGERYGLTTQIQRAAVSVVANIAEGHGRRHLGDKLQHLSIANGSLKELETHFLITERLKFLQTSDIEPALCLGEELGRMLSVLSRKLEAKRS